MASGGRRLAVRGRWPGSRVHAPQWHLTAVPRNHYILRLLGPGRQPDPATAEFLDDDSAQSTWPRTREIVENSAR
jgi:hypothetical protein